MLSRTCWRCGGWRRQVPPVPFRGRRVRFIFQTTPLALCAAIAHGEISGCYLGNVESAGLLARRNGHSPSQCEYYFFAAGGLGEAAGVAAATRTVVPVVRESEGLTITLSDSETPLRISD
jgi:hypothetical protein